MLSDEQALANKIRVQAEGVKAWIDNGRKGTLEWATGVGKSKGAIDCIKYIRSMHDYEMGLLVVPTEEMRDTDWPAEFEKWGCPTESLKLVCYASLAKEDLSKYSFIIYDEGHRLTLPNLQKLYFYKGSTLCLTATFPNSKYDEDQERVQMITELLPPVHTIKTDEAVELGLISDFEVIVLKFYIDAVTRNIAGGTKKAPRMTTEKAHYNYLTKLLQMATFKGIDGLKFACISKRQQFLYNLPSKMRLARHSLNSLMRDGDKRTLVLCGSIAQANELCGDNVFHSESSSDALDRFQRKEINTLGAVKALNEGKNLVDLDQEQINQVDSVDRNLVQRIGRAVRRRSGNPGFKARIVILVALQTADEKWYRTAIKGFETKRIKEYTVRVPDVKKVSEPVST